VSGFFVSIELRVIGYKLKLQGNNVRIKSFQGPLTIALIICLGLLSIYFSPFGIAERLDNYSQDLFNKMAGKYEFIYPSAGQKQISVLLLTDQTVDGSFEGKWPISYSAHARILNNLLRYTPKAVVIDYLWLNQEKPGVDHLLRVLNRYKKQEIPVYLTFRKLEEIDSFWPELKGLVRPISPKVSVDSSDFVARNYAFEHDGLYSSAAKVYKDLYDQDFKLENAANMQIFWGMKTNQQNAVWMDRGDKEDSGLDLLLEGFTAVKYSPPYTTTILVRDLLNPTATNEQEAHTDLTAHLRDRVVFYGGNIDGVSDLVYTPNRQIRPGVYYHAMALDNLLSLKGGYKSKKLKESIKHGWLSDFQVHLFILLIPSVIIYFRHKYKINKRLRAETDGCISEPEPQIEARVERFLTKWSKQIGRIVWQMFLIRAPLITWVFACVLICFYLLELAPSNWLGYFAFAELGFYLDNIMIFEQATGFNRERCDV
jgi:CHASE2 domain-containing sensor protein